MEMIWIFFNEQNRDYRQYMAKNMIKFIEGKYTKNDIDVFFPSALLIKEK